jgi:hypothetical protein
MDNSERLDPGKFAFHGLHPNILEGIRRRKRMDLIINNRAGGNAPMTAQQISERLQEGIYIIPPLRVSTWLKISPKKESLNPGGRFKETIE